VNREAAVILALGALAVAALCVSIGSFVLLWAERRNRRTVGPSTDPRPDRSPAAEPPAAGA
jgi:hypothetical protein